MMKGLMGAGVLGMILAGPAFAMAPGCGDQLSQIDGMMAGKPEAAAAVRGKYEQAQRLCSENKDLEAQNLTRQIREELSRSTSGSGSSDQPSSTTSGTKAPTK